MQNAMKWFDWSFGNVLALVGLVLAIILFVWAKNKMELSAVFKSIPLIERSSHGLINDIEIKYKGQDVPYFTLTQLYLWNSGNQIIEKDRFIEQDPLQLSFSKETKIIKTEIAHETRKVNKSFVKILDKGNSVLINFDFYDPKDGVRIDILHTGQELFPSFGGTIKGMPKGINIVRKEYQKSFRMWDDEISWCTLDFLLLFPLYIFFMGLLPQVIYKHLFGLSVDQHRSLMLFFLPIGFICLLFWVWFINFSSALSRYPSTLEGNLELIAKSDS